MDYKYLFTSFDGRIGRQQFWLCVVMMIIASFVLIIVLGVTIGLFLPTPVVSLIGSLIILYPALAFSIKRLHDRNKAVKPWAYIMFGPGIITNFMQALGIGFTSTVIDGEVATFPTSGPAILMSAITAIVGIWVLVELGFLKGTDGDNQFGPDPVAS